MAAAVLGGSETPGRRKTARCAKGRGFEGVVPGRKYRKDVGFGCEVGVVWSGWPAGRRPKRGCVAIDWSWGLMLCGRRGELRVGEVRRG